MCTCAQLRAENARLRSENAQMRHQMSMAVMHVRSCEESLSEQSIYVREMEEDASNQSRLIGRLMRQITALGGTPNMQYT